MRCLKAKYGVFILNLIEGDKIHHQIGEGNWNYIIHFCWSRENKYLKKESTPFTEKNRREYDARRVPLALVSQNCFKIKY